MHGSTKRSQNGLVLRWLLAILAIVGLGAADTVTAQPVGPGDGVILLASSDAEGHLTPCSTCPMHTGDGGVGRRATAIATMRQQTRDVLLVDAGNWLVGADSVGSRGNASVAAYAALGYDAVNLSVRDLYWGRDHTLKLLRESGVKAVSASLVRTDTNQPLVEPFVVLRLAGRRIAVLGVCEPPTAMDALPRLRQQMTGLKVVAPAEAIANWLPKAAEASDQVVVLYEGSSATLRVLLPSLKDVSVVVASGMREAPAVADRPPIMVSAEHGKSLASARLAANGPAVDLRQVRITPELVADATLEKTVAAANGAAADPWDPTAKTASAPTTPVIPSLSPATAPALATTPNPPTQPVTAIPPADTAVPHVAEVPSPAKPPAAMPSTSPASAPAVATTEPPHEPPPPAPPATAPAKRPNFCTHCGARLTPTGNFCTQCGNKISQ